MTWNVVLLLVVGLAALVGGAELLASRGRA